jgi:hypothetical protein
VKTKSLLDGVNFGPREQKRKLSNVEILSQLDDHLLRKILAVPGLNLNDDSSECGDGEVGEISGLITI